MGSKAHSVEGLHLRIRPPEFRNIAETITLVSIFPHEEGLIYCVEGVEFKLIIGVFAGNENFDIVVLPDGIVVLPEGCLDVRFLNPIGDIKIFLVPEHSSMSVERSWLAGDNIHKTRRARRGLPARLIGNAVNRDGLTHAVSGIMGGGIRVARKNGAAGDDTVGILGVSPPRGGKQDGQQGSSKDMGI